jgi:hypothetical protein
MEELTLSFFRKTPAALATNPALLSSLQCLESSFFLIALHRYPHALSTCASAFEMSIEGSKISVGTKDGLRKRIKKAQDNSLQIARMSDSCVDRFCRVRNQITHNGFGSNDNSESVSLYLEIGIPLLAASYGEFHCFDLKDALLQEYAELLDMANRVCIRAKALPVSDLSYCLNPFGHMIRWCFKDNFSTHWEIGALVRADEIGLKFEDIHKEKERLERLFGASWTFNCGICNDVESVVCELDESELDSLKIVPKRMACTACGFAVRETHAFLSEALLQDQIEKSRSDILSEYGLI